MGAIHFIGRLLEFPDPCLANEEGLVAVGGDLSPERLLLGYRSGIFPWTANPVTWWSPNPRGILPLDQFHIPRSLTRVLRQRQFEVTVDKAFRAVMQSCAKSARGRETTWIEPEFIEAYTQLHYLGHAHSLECWQRGELAGGIYGVAINGLFAGESMFHNVPDASKVALVKLVQVLVSQGFALFDLQMVTPITARFGAIEVDRNEYLARLKVALESEARFQPGTASLQL